MLSYFFWGYMDNQSLINDEFNVKPYSPSIGGVITGINLSKKNNKVKVKFCKSLFLKI